MRYTAKSFEQQTDSKRIWICPGNRLCTKTLDNRLLSVCCPTYRTNVTLSFPVIIVCFLMKCFFLDFHIIFYSFSFRYIGQLLVHKRTANGLPKYSSTVQQTDVQNIRQPCVHKCSSAQEHSSSDTLDSKQTANGHPKSSSTVWHLYIFVVYGLMLQLQNMPYIKSAWFIRGIKFIDALNDALMNPWLSCITTTAGHPERKGWVAKR